MKHAFTRRPAERFNSEKRMAMQHMTAPSSSAGFFTIGIAVAILALCGGIAGGTGALSRDAVPAVATPTPAGDDHAGFAEPTRQSRTKDVLVGEATIQSPKGQP